MRALLTRGARFSVIALAVSERIGLRVLRRETGRRLSDTAICVTQQKHVTSQLSRRVTAVTLRPRETSSCTSTCANRRASQTTYLQAQDLPRRLLESEDDSSESTTIILIRRRDTITENHRGLLAISDPTRGSVPWSYAHAVGLTRHQFTGPNVAAGCRSRTRRSSRRAQSATANPQP